ncbi:MAG: hypothetical protein ABIM62_05625 [candidate division WOR-3 bacterium]
MKRYILILSIMWIFTKFNFLYGMESDKNLLRSYPYDLSSIKNFYLKQNTISHMLILYPQNKSLRSNLGKNLLTYALEFTASSIMPTLCTVGYMYGSAIDPPPWTWEEVFSFCKSYTILNCISVPLTTHIIGKLMKKGGNLYTSLIGTFLGCTPTWIIINYHNKFYLSITDYPDNLFLLLMAFGPSLGGVIGYNLK